MLIEVPVIVCEEHEDINSCAHIDFNHIIIFEPSHNNKTTLVTMDVGDIALEVDMPYRKFIQLYEGIFEQYNYAINDC